MTQYNKLSDAEKRKFIEKNYYDNNLSLANIAEIAGTYSNKIRRDAIKFNIKLRDKSDAQKNALSTGAHKHPTKGQERSEQTKLKIGKGLVESWDSLSDKELKQRKKKAKELWEAKSEDEKANLMHKANVAVRQASKDGSKLEKFLLQQLIKDGYRPEFHKEQSLVNTKLQIDIFLPTMNVAIEVDGPSHFLPVWGEDSLDKNRKYDNKKTGLILGKGLVLIRVQQLKDYSKSRALIFYEELKKHLQDIQQEFPKSDNRLIIITE